MSESRTNEWIERWRRIDSLIITRMNLLKDLAAVDGGASVQVTVKGQYQHDQKVLDAARNAVIESIEDCLKINDNDLLNLSVNVSSVEH